MKLQKEALTEQKDKQKQGWIVLKSKIVDLSYLEKYEKLENVSTEQIQLGGKINDIIR